MSKITKYAFYLIFITLCACQKRSESLLAIKNYRSNFQQSITAWSKGYSNLKPADTATDTAFTILRTNLPTGLDTTAYSLKWTSHNLQKNAIAYIQSEMKGLNPNHTYQLTFQLQMASAYPASSDAGSKVYLKAGAISYEPMTNPITGLINFDKGLPAEDGRDLYVLGNIAKDSNRSGFGIIQRNNLSRPFSIKANSEGKIWLCIATDSEYSGSSLLYLERIEATITEN